MAVRHQRILTLALVIVVTALVLPPSAVAGDRAIERLGLNGASSAYDANDIPGVLDLERATLRLTGGALVLRLKTYDPWTTRALLGCERFVWLWPDPGLRAWVDYTRHGGLSLTVRDDRSGSLVLKTRATHPTPRSVLAKVPTDQVARTWATAKWVATSMSAAGGPCLGAIFRDRVPDAGYLVP